MAQSLDRRMKFAERRNKAPLPWLKHKLYLVRLWTGAYMLDNWEILLMISFTSVVCWGVYRLAFSS
jgi:hypothetical protein